MSGLFWIAEEEYILQLKTSLIIISLLCLMAAQLEAMFARAECCAEREHVAALRLIMRALFRVANLLLIYASVIENGSLMQIYVWYTLAYIVVGVPVAIADMLLGLKHEERIAVDFVTEIVFLFVLSRCLPVVNTYRIQLTELERAKW
ncbi:uncharacterized protein LOC133529669 [Cydia pomonella]|uniref:uncharacterized protein LOC133529669 n=1 Tax=Cydia pomonella TaxID=82600 RepID=UPI002ADE116F|nr:uncharacterized protein LOC133529669 [Cydia pomonella]